LSELQTHTQSIYKWSLERPQAIAIIAGKDKYTYENFVVNIARYIKAFECVGIKKGMLVGVYLGPQQRVFELILSYSLEAIGAIRITQLSENEVVKRCDFIFTIPKFSKIESNATIIHITQEWINAATKARLVSADLERLNYQPAPADAIFFGSTSGTTGQKKYFFDSYASIQAQFSLMKAIYFQAEISNFLSLYSVGLGAAYIGCSLALIKGGTIIFTSQDLFVKDINRYPNSHSAMILRDASYFQRSFKDEIHGGKLSTLRVLGAHLPIQNRSWLEKNLAKEVFNSYSSNESGQICEVRADGLGDIYPGVSVKIVNENWECLSFGEQGIIAIKSPMQISKYLWNAELNLNHFKEGWFYSNDIGYMTQEGKLVVVDRADNMLNLGGIKIPPKPIEDSLRLITGVNDCALLSENLFFEFETLLVCYEVSAMSDKNAIDASTKKVLADRFKSYRISYYEHFPRTETGKIQKKELQKLVLEVLSLDKCQLS
jgi:acyl-coenzyme A synthetase/AMP-(fatty) acid ligase